MAGRIIGDASREGLRKMASEFERVVQACNLISERVFGLSIEELIQSYPNIRNAIIESVKMAKETIVNIVNDEIYRAIGTTPVPESEEDKRLGAFDLKTMEEYVKRGGYAAEIIVGFAQREYCWRYNNYPKPPGVILKVYDFKNKRLPSALLKPLVTSEGELVLDRSRHFVPITTRRSIMWLPIRKEIVAEHLENLERAFDIYHMMTFSERITPRGGRYPCYDFEYLPKCDDLTDYLWVNIVIHTPEKHQQEDEEK
jgi:hypothetical protein